MKPWIKVFDHGEPRSTIQQLCIARDHIYSIWENWLANNRKDNLDGSLKTEDDAKKIQESFNFKLRESYRLAMEIDVFISGYLCGLESEQKK